MIISIISSLCFFSAPLYQIVLNRPSKNRSPTNGIALVVGVLLEILRKSAGTADTKKEHRRF